VCSKVVVWSLLSSWHITSVDTIPLNEVSPGDTQDCVANELQLTNIRSHVLEEAWLELINFRKKLLITCSDPFSCSETLAQLFSTVVHVLTIFETSIRSDPARC
jgi:hypothetical protein